MPAIKPRHARPEVRRNESPMSRGVLRTSSIANQQSQTSQIMRAFVRLRGTELPIQAIAAKSKIPQADLNHNITQ